MANFVLAYKGGAEPSTEAEGQAVMAAWTAWFGKIAQSVVDHGNPFAASKTVAQDGSVRDGGASDLSGYSVVTAADIDGATELATSCPILANGGSVEIYEIHPLM